MKAPAVNARRIGEYSDATFPITMEIAAPTTADEPEKKLYRSALRGDNPPWTSTPNSPISWGI